MKASLVLALAFAASTSPVLGQETRLDCSLPKPAAAARTVLLSAYQGDALSTTGIGTQDVSVRTASIDVEAGSEPLYVVALSYRPMIWRLVGAVERVERIVLASQSTEPNGSRPDGRPIVGASGIPADKVTFLPRPTCLEDFSEMRSKEATRTIGIVRKATGNEPVVVADYAVSGFAIPSAALLPSRSSAKAATGIAIANDGKALNVDLSKKPRMQAAGNDLDNEVGRFYPGGVVDIDPRTVVASGKPIRYDVLPGKAGILQLVRSGALSQNERGQFVINAKMRFPAGLYGAESARFVLPRDIPTPEGDPGHSCVVKEGVGDTKDDPDTDC